MTRTARGVLVPFQLDPPNVSRAARASHQAVRAADYLALIVGTALVLLLPGAIAAQAAPPVYRGFSPGMGYREFAARARALSDRDMLRCNTSTNTARIMECGVVMRDPADSARFYLSAHFIDGDADVVALYDSAGFGDNRGVRLVDATRRHLTRVYGRPRVVKTGMWEWRYGRQAVRFSWRGRATARWVSITLTDYAVMDRISRFVVPSARKKS